MAQTYTQVARYLHWAVAGLILLQFVLALWAESLEEANASLRQLAVMANHKSVGMTILMLATVRLVWRVRHPPPALVDTMPRWQSVSANIAHWLMYGFLFAMPVTGWLMSSASAYSVSWFNLFTFPDLVAANPQAKEVFEAVHELLAKALFITVSVHAIAALVHHYRDHDDTLTRMLNPGALTIGVLLLAAGIWQLGFAGNTVSTPASPSAPMPLTAPGKTASAPISPPSDAVSTLPVWQIDYAASAIGFTAEQAGAPFTGSFSHWQANIRFDPERLEQSHASVTITLSSVDTKDSERDETLSQQQWFGAGLAEFYASGFERSATGEFTTTNATLAFAGHPRPVDFSFTIDYLEDRSILQGHARLDRLDLQVGTGDWTDTTWVGQYVDVDIHVEATSRSDR